MLLKGYYSTTQAAMKLGVKAGTIRDAVARGVLVVVRVPEIPHRNFIEEAELERWAATRRQGKGKGWEKRKDPAYQPNPRNRQYHQAYRARTKAPEAGQVVVLGKEEETA